jgi:hypothetical protein
MYVHNVIKCVYLFFFSGSFLTFIESMVRKIQIITPHQLIIYLLINRKNLYALVKNPYKMMVDIVNDKKQ